jgi:coronin-1B/1C/6
MAQPRPKGTAIVRQSKYRHLFGSHAQNTECVGSLKIGSLQVDSNIVKANEKFFSIPWMGNGCIAIIPLTQKGAINPELPLIEFEENIINDFNFHPFNNYLLVSASNDGIIAFWKIPEEGLTENIHIPIKTIKASEKRLLTVDFHNLASDVMLTIDSNKIIKLWDIEKCQDQITLPEIHKALLTNISWSPDGRLLATSCKDKILRIFDPRSNKCIEETSDHPGTKGSRVLWIAKKDFIFTCGFGKGSERQYALYDPRKLSQRLTLQPIDSSSSTLLPFVDNDNGIIFLAGKVYRIFEN